VSGALARLLAEALERGGEQLANTAGERAEPGALLRSAAHVAAALRSGGVRPDEPVLVVMGNRPADFGALLGVWLADAVAVPVHASAAPATLRSLRDATAARLLIDGEEVRALASERPPQRPLLRGAALVIFTSGSTGRPKGVVIGHERFAGKLDALSRLLRFGPDDTVVVPLQLTFIFGLWVSLLALDAGATLILMPKFSAETAARSLDAGGTVLAAVPTMLRALLSGPPIAAPALRTILTGGEALAPALAGALGQAFPNAGLWDLYGLTETGSCDFRLAPLDQPAGIGSLGHPTEGVTFRLMGEDGWPAPEGSPGELQIRTPFGMLGYLDDAALTQASFGDGFFRTGDLARLRPDGRIELVGRSKEIIVRGGNKIAPLEIDNLLSSHPDVAAALCAGVPDARVGEAIHAVVVLKPGLRLTADALRRWASERIERYKVPDVIEVRDALPVGATGKASRSAILADKSSGKER
jgi:long-chain acyl-CoA synthetase